MMTKEVTQIDFYKQNPYAIILRDNLDPSYFVSTRDEHVKKNMDGSFRMSNTRATTAKSFIARKNRSQDQSNLFKKPLESNVDELCKARSTFDQIAKFEGTMDFNNKKDNRVIKGYPGIKFELFIAQTKDISNPMVSSQQAQFKEIQDKQDKLLTKNNLIIY